MFRVQGLGYLWCMFRPCCVRVYRCLLFCFGVFLLRSLFTELGHEFQMGAFKLSVFCTLYVHHKDPLGG